MKLFAAVIAAAVLVSAAPSGAAGKSAAVAGKYEGWVRGSSQGDMPMTVTLAQDGDTITGGMDAGSGRFVFTISDGKIDGTKLSWNFADSQVSGSIEGTYAGDTIKGTWSASGEGGTFDVKRTAAH